MGRRRMIEDDLGFLLTRASALMIKATNEALASLDLKVRAYSVLSVVCDGPGGVTQRTLADDVSLDPSQIVALIDELEGRGLVIRTVDSNDRRNKLIVATKDGRNLCTQAQRRTAKATATHTAAFPPQAIEQMRKILSQMVFPDTDEATS